MMRLIWPTNVTHTPSPIVRAGRVIHWLGTLAAALTVAAYGLGWFDESWPRYGFWAQHLWMLAAALGLYCLGRGIRYVLAAE